MTIAFPRILYVVPDVATLVKNELYVRSMVCYAYL